MQPSGYSPYQATEPRKKFSLKRIKIPKLPKFSGGFKKWALIILGFLFSIFLLVYLCMGDLRFFANNFLKLGFFHKDYLIVFQNNHELRPTGGFITGYGEIGVTMGIPSSLSFHNSYEIDTEEYVTPPYPHEELLKNEWYEGYTFRDANWNPNFPESVNTMIDFYQKKYPEKEVDGIIVVNFSLIEDLVGGLGGLEVNGETLTKENLFKKITDSVNDVDRHSEAALSDRKSILGQLAGPLMSGLKFHPFKAKSVVIEGLENKDLYFWFANEKLQQKIEKKGWANTMTIPENSDFLAVNLANLGAKKTDRYLIKVVFQQVNLQDEDPVVTTEVILRYPGETNIYSDNYRGYLRLYLPAGAELISEVGDLRVETEGNFKVIGALVDLKANENKVFRFQYKLPVSILSDNVYDLKINKQSGDNTFYMIEVETDNDHGMTAIEMENFTSVEPFQVKENKAYWSGYPKNDVKFRLSLLEDTSPPYPVEQVFDDLNTISIYWNEAVSPSSGGEPSNYQITDINRIDKNTTDEVKVTGVEVKDNLTKLTLEGVSEQELERYEITLKGIRDVSNHLIEPDPKVITAVQRFN